MKSYDRLPFKKFLRHMVPYTYQKCSYEKQLWSLCDSVWKWSNTICYFQKQKQELFTNCVHFCGIYCMKTRDNFLNMIPKWILDMYIVWGTPMKGICGYSQISLKIVLGPILPMGSSTVILIWWKVLLCCNSHGSSDCYNYWHDKSTAIVSYTKITAIFYKEIVLLTKQGWQN